MGRLHQEEPAKEVVLQAFLEIVSYLPNKNNPSRARKVHVCVRLFCDLETLYVSMDVLNAGLLLHPVLL